MIIKLAGFYASCPVPVAQTAEKPLERSPLVSSPTWLYSIIKFGSLSLSYGCETWSLTLREERRLRVFENRNRVLRRVYGPKRDEVTGNGENYIMKSLVICTPYRILCGW